MKEVGASAVVGRGGNLVIQATFDEGECPFVLKLAPVQPGPERASELRDTARRPSPRLNEADKDEGASRSKAAEERGDGVRENRGREAGRGGAGKEGGRSRSRSREREKSLGVCRGPGGGGERKYNRDSPGRRGVDGSRYLPRNHSRSRERDRSREREREREWVRAREREREGGRESGSGNNGSGNKLPDAPRGRERERIERE